VAGLLATLWQAGHAAYVVGGCLRDTLLSREPADWDLATDASPDRVVTLFPHAVYENRYGTVVVRKAGVQYEITAFRRDATYSDFRHPDAVEFGESIEEDLARRDFTVNAMAWGAPAGVEAGLVDPHGGRDDLGRRFLRAVGDPDRRFGEDALRMVRAVRLAAKLEFSIEAETYAAIGRNADLARHLSGERVFSELLKLLSAREPSIGLSLMADSGLLDVIGPDLAREGGKYPHAWHFDHLFDPRSISVGSIMPAYPWLFSHGADIGALKNKIDVLRTLGVPYPAWSAAEIEAAAMDQAKQITRDLRTQERLVAPDREIVSLIAYLQKLGKYESVTSPSIATGAEK